uniref:Retrotransposon protein, putative, Ty1-copia subclass n=1 Tax=Tanacetum cinerariifolium TaxID=118510 RepID=A0A6L2JEE4_TANCI|nr:hypothetical protein [Tanacetum cinerariifolium]
MQEKLKLSKSQGASTLVEVKRMQNVPYALRWDPLCELHWTVVKNILNYLLNAKDMFLIYEVDVKRELRVSCYTDVRYLTDADDLKSQTGYVFILNGGVIDWKSIKQSIFATSSAKAEYIAASNTSKEAIEKVHTDDNLADPFTKALAFPKHLEHTKNIGMLPARNLM